MKGNEKRIITLCIGLFLWVVYIFQSTLAGYGIYEVVSFQMWEVIGYIPYICRAISVIWLLSLFIAVIRKRKTHASDKWFLVVLLVVILWQNHYINDMNEQRSTTVPVEVVSIDPYQNMLTVQTLEKKSTIILEAPMLVHNIVEPGRQYTVTYEWDGANSNKGKLRMIRLSEPSTDTLTQTEIALLRERYPINDAEPPLIETMPLSLEDWIARCDCYAVVEVISEPEARLVSGFAFVNHEVQILNDIFDSIEKDIIELSYSRELSIRKPAMNVGDKFIVGGVYNEKTGTINISSDTMFYVTDDDYILSVKSEESKNRHTGTKVEAFLEYLKIVKSEVN